MTIYETTASELAKEESLTVIVRVKKDLKYTTRYWLSLKLIRIFAKVCPYNVVVDEEAKLEKLNWERIFLSVCPAIVTTTSIILMRCTSIMEITNEALMIFTAMHIGLWFGYFWHWLLKAM